jgi:hypothetical protein
MRGALLPLSRSIGSPFALARPRPPGSATDGRTGALHPSEQMIDPPSAGAGVSPRRWDGNGTRQAMATRVRGAAAGALGFGYPSSLGARPSIGGWIDPSRVFGARAFVRLTLRGQSISGYVRLGAGPDPCTNRRSFLVRRARMHAFWLAICVNFNGPCFFLQCARRNRSLEVLSGTIERRRTVTVREQSTLCACETAGSTTVQYVV